MFMITIDCVLCDQQQASILLFQEPDIEKLEAKIGDGQIEQVIHQVSGISSMTIDFVPRSMVYNFATDLLHRRFSLKGTVFDEISTHPV